MTTPESESFDMNAVLRAATGRGQTTETEPSTTNDEPEPELSMNDLLRRATGRRYLQPDEEPSETTKLSGNQLFNAMLRADLHSRRQFSFGKPSGAETEETS